MLLPWSLHALWAAVTLSEVTLGSLEEFVRQDCPLIVGVVFIVCSFIWAYNYQHSKGTNGSKLIYGTFLRGLALLIVQLGAATLVLMLVFGTMLQRHFLR